MPSDTNVQARFYVGASTKYYRRLDGGCCRLLELLYNTLKQKVLEADYILADESPIKVLDSDKKGSTHQGYQWVYHNPINKLVLFNYRKGRGQHGSKELLAHYRGYLQCDGYVAYDKIGAVPKITLAGCLVHARRKFHDALDSDKIIISGIFYNILILSALIY